MSSTTGLLLTAKAVAAEPAVNLNNTLGALLVGLIFAATYVPELGGTSIYYMYSFLPEYLLADSVSS